MTTRFCALAGASLAMLAISACAPAPAPTAATTPAATPTTATPTTAPSLNTAALLAPDGRLPNDATDDAARKPAEVLAFAGIATGQTVFEMEAGGGYYTELLSKAVGSGGHVTMQAPMEFESFYKKGLEARLKDNRLANVTVSWSPFDKLDAKDGTVDVATWFLGPHELYFKQPGFPKGLGEPVKVYTEVFRILKPGGYFVVMDHVAVAGAKPEESGDKLHRIDPAQLRAGLTKAGFKIEEESTLLANPADAHTVAAIDPSMHFKTDQFLFRAVKPK
jgi:predicted methyltransferase